MAEVFGKVVVDPQGQEVDVTFTTPAGATPTVYSDEAGSSSVSLPSTITTKTTYYLTRGQYNVSVKRNDVEIAGKGGATLPVEFFQQGTAYSIAPTVDIPQEESALTPSGTSGVVEVRTATGTTDTLVLADAGKVVRYTNASAVTATVPPNSDVAFSTGTIINIYSGGAGGVTIAAGAGVTIRNNGTALSQYDEVSLRKDGTDEWVRVG